MNRDVLLTVKCARRRHVLAVVVGETAPGADEGTVYIEANQAGRSRRHGAAGNPARRAYGEGDGSRYGCACGSTLILDKALRRAVRDGYTEFITTVQ